MTDRHRVLADRTVRGGQMAGDAVVERVAQLLADEDDRRVPVEALAAAYGRGRRDTARRVLDELDRRTAGHPNLTAAAACAELAAWVERELTPQQETRTDD